MLQAAYAAVVASEVAIITTLNTQIDRLGAVVGEHFGRHRDAEIYTSLPGLGVIRDGGHLDLSKRTRVTKIRLFTHLRWEDGAMPDGTPPLPGVRTEDRHGQPSLEQESQAAVAASSACRRDDLQPETAVDRI